MAPKVSVFVERAFEIMGANFETSLAASLEDALTGTRTSWCSPSARPRRDQPLKTFNEFYERRIRYIKGLVVLAPAATTSKPRRTWPAALPEVIAVGALSANGRDRA